MYHFKYYKQLFNSNTYTTEIYERLLVKIHYKKHINPLDNSYIIETILHVEICEDNSVFSQD